MVQSPSSEANWFAVSQEITRISRNPKFHYRTHKRPPPVSILGQPNPVHIPTSHLLEIRPSIIHPSRPRSPPWSLSLRFHHQDPTHPSPHSYVPHAQPISFFSILSPAQYWVRSTDHSAPRYAISSIPPLPRPSSVQILSSTPCSVLKPYCCQFTSLIHLTFIPSYNSFTSDTELTNYENHTWCIIVVNAITKWLDQWTHYNYGNYIVYSLRSMNPL